MEDIDSQMVTLKQQGAAARGYKGQLTKVTKILERAKEQLDSASFQEAQACYNNLTRQFDNFNKALDKLENCIADMSVTIELGFSLANDIKKGDARNVYLEKLGKLKGNINKSEEDGGRIFRQHGEDTEARHRGDGHKGGGEREGSGGKVQS